MIENKDNQRKEMLKAFYEKINNGTYFTKSQQTYIQQQVDQVDLVVKKQFNKAYPEWQNECFQSGLPDIHCNILESINILKVIGKASIPLYIEMLANATYMPLVAYNEIKEPSLQSQSHLPFDNPIVYDGGYQAIHTVDFWLADHHIA